MAKFDFSKIGLSREKLSGVDWSNIARNVASHTLLAFTAIALAQILLHVEGLIQPATGIAYFGHGLIYKVGDHGLIALIPQSQTVALMVRIVPIFCVLVLIGAFVEPKKDVEKAGPDGRLRIVIKRDDPYFLAWPCRVLGVLLAVGAGYLWGNQMLALLETWLGG